MSSHMVEVQEGDLAAILFGHHDEGVHPLIRLQQTSRCVKA